MDDKIKIARKKTIIEKERISHFFMIKIWLNQFLGNWVKYINNSLASIDLSYVMNYWKFRIFNNNIADIFEKYFPFMKYWKLDK